MVRISCWSQDTGHIEVMVQMSDRTAYTRGHAARLLEWLAAEDSSTNHVYELVVVENR